MPSFGTLKADTLTHSTAGSVDTNYVVEGTAKSWINLNGSSFGTRDSFNVSSATDTSTGQYKINYTNSMNNANYSCVIGDELNGGRCFPRTTDYNTSYHDHEVFGQSSGYVDNTIVTDATFGDLA